MITRNRTLPQVARRAGRSVFGLLWPIALFYWVFSLTGPHPLRRTLGLLAVMLLVLVVMVGPFAVMRRRRLRTLAQRWQSVWAPPGASTHDETWGAR